jgi:hypothetical protein
MPRHHWHALPEGHKPSGKRAPFRLRDDGRYEVWTGSQLPDVLYEDVPPVCLHGHEGAMRTNSAGHWTCAVCRKAQMADHNSRPENREARRQWYHTLSPEQREERRAKEREAARARRREPAIA